MTGLFRTASGGRIDRSRRLSFSFDGRRLEGLAGDTLASALLANGVHLVGRSFKYHRPRGLLAAGCEEPNALVTIERGGGRTTPNCQATRVELYDGVVAWSQNRWPSLAHDLGAVADRLAPLIPAGFYYKTFIGPAGAWQALYEPLIRKAAGLGVAPTAPDPDRYQQRYAHCDVLVVGGGPAGLSAALAASAAGARVILCDEQSEIGGSLLAESVATFDGKPAQLWLAETVARLAADPRVRLLARTTAFGYFADNMLGLVERLADHHAVADPSVPRERLWQVRAKAVVLATGAIERPLVFPGNDRPGILLADAARTYLNRYGAAVGGTAVVATACDSAYRAALDLKAGGISVPLIVDLRRRPPLAAQARQAGIRVLDEATVIATTGRLRIGAVTVAPVAGGARDVETIACDTLLMSGGWTPSVHLFSQSRGALAWSDTHGAYLPGAPHERCWSAGACNGTLTYQDAIRQGIEVGRTATLAAKTLADSAVPATVAAPSVAHETPTVGGHLGACPKGPQASRQKAFVDLQNDVTLKDLALAAREGFRSIEHVKRYTTTGMATDQGKTSSLNALAVVAQHRIAPIVDVGHTTFRMPYTPVTFGALAGVARGSLLDPVRTTPMHAAAVARGAVFEDVGAWKRARYFPQAGEDMHAAVARECRTVRARVGLFDASTLGKIDVQGPDAAAFLARIYANHWPKLSPGGCRYGLMLKDDGFVLDDGIAAMLAPGHYHLTTTTGGAARVLHHMEDYLQTEWPDLRCWLTSVTEQWAVIAVQGPRARDVLAPLVEGVDLSGRAMPHMSVREGTICGVAMRLFRVSFTGEVGYEVNVPADHGAAILEAIAAEVARHEGTWYGTEAMHVLRAEKGYIIVGQETDGTVTADDLGLGAMVGMGKPDFVGKRGLLRADLAAPGRRQLVGLACEDPRIVLEEGAQVVERPDPEPGSHAIGHVTSAYMSEAAGRGIALALVERGRSRMGERLFVPMPGGAIAVEIRGTVVHDKLGERVHG